MDLCGFSYMCFFVFLFGCLFLWREVGGGGGGGLFKFYFFLKSSFWIFVDFCVVVCCVFFFFFHGVAFFSIYLFLKSRSL